MKRPLLLILAGLEITFALPTFAQQKDRGDAGIASNVISSGFPRPLVSSACSG
jgi:hypothetical protein